MEWLELGSPCHLTPISDLNRHIHDPRVKTTYSVVSKSQEGMLLEKGGGKRNYLSCGEAGCAVASRLDEWLKQRDSDSPLSSEQ